MTRSYKLRAEKVDWREIEGEIVALDHDRAQYLGINRTGALLWTRLVHGTTFDEMRDALAAEFGVTPDRAAADVTAFVEMLEGHGLLDHGAREG